MYIMYIILYIHTVYIQHIMFLYYYVHYICTLHSVFSSIHTVHTYILDANVKDIDVLQKLQNKALRTILRCDWFTHSKDMLKKIGVAINQSTNSN
jgi:hypothetical protein